MAQIAITIPDNVVNEVLDAFADKYGWTIKLNRIEVVTGMVTQWLNQ